MKESTKRKIALVFSTLVLVPVGIWGNAVFGFGLLGAIYLTFIVHWIKKK